MKRFKPKPPFFPTAMLVGLSPSSGGAGDSISLLGANFREAVGVQFGSTAVPFTLVSSSEISCTVPPGSGTAQVTVASEGGISAAQAFTYTDAGLISNALSTPVEKAVGLGSNSLQAYPIWVPSDVTSIDIAISNRNCLDPAQHGGPVTNISVAAGTPNVGLTDWATPPTVTAGLSVDGSGGLTWVLDVPVTRNAAGYIMVAWLMTAAGASGSYVIQENGNGWGLVGTGSDITNLSGTSSRSVGTDVFGFISVRYTTALPRLVSFGDSITQGVLAQRNTTPENTLPSLGASFAAGSAGCGSLTAQAVASGRSIDFDACSFEGNDVLIRLGTNDLIGMRTKAQIETDLQTIMAAVRELGANKVGLATVLPSSGYDGTQNGYLAGLNSDILALTTLGNDFAVDLYALLKDPDANQILPAYAADAYHPNATGQAAMRPGYPDPLP